MVTRIMHTGDVHLGASFSGMGRNGSRMRAQLLETFASVVELALREKVHIFLIAGDLFDSACPPAALVGRAAALLERLTRAGVRVCIAPGTHDPYGSGSPYTAEPMTGIAGLTIFSSEELAPVGFPELGCTVFGCANMKPYRNRYPLAGFSPPGAAGRAIGVLHAGFEVPDLIEDTYMVTSSQVAASSLDYLALGHYHSLSDRSAGGVAAYYCGSPEMVRVQKGGPGCVLIVDLDREVRVTPVLAGRRSVEELTLQAEGIDSEARLSSVLGKLADPDKVLKVSVRGVRGLDYPDVDRVVEEISGRFFHVSFTDRSLASPESVDPSAYPVGSAAAAYLGLLARRLEAAGEGERHELLEAMRIGAAMLDPGCG